MPKIAVIIPTHNRLSLLPRALASVVQQSYQDFEVWVVVDGSTDGTRDFFLEWAESSGEVERFNYFFQNQSGVSRARNMGVHLSKAPFLAFLDSDDEWLPHKLELQLEAYQNYGHRLIHSEELWFRNGTQVKVPAKYKKNGGRIFLNCLDVCAISPSTVMMERALFEEVGGFNEEFLVCEDYDLWLRICSRYEVGLVENPLIIKHGGHIDQLSTQYRAMDYYRVLALEKILRAPGLTSLERESTRKVMIAKCKILLEGHKKRAGEKFPALTLAQIEVLKKIATKSSS